MFEFIRAGVGEEFTITVLVEFSKIVLFGCTFGFTFAHALAFAVKKKIIPHYLLNVVTLAMVLGVFVLSDAFAHESGLLSVVVMGMVLGNINLPHINEILYFKESLSVLLISILFILLAANINIEDLVLIYNWQAVILFAIIVLVVRPIGVFLSAMKSGLKTNEKLFISWVGPRGIVAAGIASLFGLKLQKEGIVGAEYITPLVFMIVLGTVLLNATTARLFAKLVGVFLTKSEGILIIGCSKISRLIAAYLKSNGRHVVLVDSNRDNIRKAQSLGLEAVEGNIYGDKLGDNIELNDTGYLMALTANSDINKFAINKFKNQFGEHGAFRLITPDEMQDPENNPHEGLFSHTDDYYNLTEVAEKYPGIQEIKLKDEAHFQTLIDITANDKEIIPLFIRDSKEILIIPSFSEEITEIEEGSFLAYIGKPIDIEGVK